MARAHSTTIIDAIIAALRAIDSSGNDSFTPSIVQRHDEDRSVEGPPWSIIVRRTGEQRTRSRESSDWPITLQVEIDVNVDTGPDSALPSDESIAEASEDVFRALNAMDWVTLRAEFTSFIPTTFRDEDPEHPVAGFVAAVEIEYAVGYEDPSTITNL